MDFSRFMSGAAGAPPTAPNVPPGYPSAGNPSLGVAATKPGAYWFFQLQSEMAHLLAAAGITPDASALDQLASAIDRLIALSKVNPTFLGSSGVEGGQINLALPASGSALDAPVAVDCAGDAVRIVGSVGGVKRWLQCDLAALGAGAHTLAVADDIVAALINPTFHAASGVGEGVGARLRLAAPAAGTVFEAPLTIDLYGNYLRISSTVGGATSQVYLDFSALPGNRMIATVGPRVIAAQGYQVLAGDPYPLIEQWGITGTIAPDASETVTLPLTWPHAVFSVVVTPISGPSYDCTGNVSLSGLSTMTIGRSWSGAGTATAGQMYWRAIGY